MFHLIVTEEPETQCYDHHKLSDWSRQPLHYGLKDFIALIESLSLTLKLLEKVVHCAAIVGTFQGISLSFTKSC